MNKLGLIGLIGAVILSGCSKKDDEKIRPSVQIQGLEVNTNNAYRGVVSASREEGVSQLRRLADNSLFEEAWLFDPRENKWYEIGVNETSSFDVPKGVKLDENMTKSLSIDPQLLPDFSCGSKIDLKFYTYMVKNAGEVNFYHIHPSGKAVMDELSRRTRENNSFDENQYKTFIGLLENAVKFSNSRCSDGDAEMFVKLARRTDKEDRRRKLNFIAVSTSGVSTLSVNHSGIKYIQSLSPEDFYGLYTTITEKLDKNFDEDAANNPAMSYRYNKVLRTRTISYSFSPFLDEINVSSR